MSRVNRSSRSLRRGCPNAERVARVSVPLVPVPQPVAAALIPNAADRVVALRRQLRPQDSANPSRCCPSQDARRRGEGEGLRADGEMGAGQARGRRGEQMTVRVEPDDGLPGMDKTRIVQPGTCVRVAV